MTGKQVVTSSPDMAWKAGKALSISRTVRHVFTKRYLYESMVDTGKVYGSMPTLTSGNLDDGDVPITTHYSQALSEIVSKRLLNDKLDEVFPGFTPKPALGIA